jgi:hypothetical protein
MNKEIQSIVGNLSGQTKNGFLIGMQGIIKNLSPSYFAMVMATGIVSIAADFLGMTWIAIRLYYPCVLFFSKKNFFMICSTMPSDLVFSQLLLPPVFWAGSLLSYGKILRLQ